MLGLMGTLIPMGPALRGGAMGNLESLAENMIVAFTTTVVGLLIGGLCYGMYLSRQYWYARDLADIEHVFEKAFPERVREEPRQC